MVGRAGEVGVGKGSRAYRARFQRAAQAGDANAQYTLGEWYENGLGRRENPEKAFFWYQRAAAQGHAGARRKFEEDCRSAYYRERLAAEGGDPDACYALGARHEMGDGVRRDRGRAMRWYRRAAKGGDPEAAYALGRLHEQNTRWHGLELACRWYKEAAELGHPEARGRCDAVRKRLS